MSRKARTLLVAWSFVVVSALAVLFLPVPYVVLTPTQPTDTLGMDPNTPDKPVLDVIGAPTRPTTGHLLLTTVGVITGHVSLGSALRRWVSGPDAVVPRSVEYPPNQSKAKVDQENIQQMTDSRQAAVIAALAEAKFPQTVIGGFATGSKADGPLKVGDQITDIDATPTATFEEVAALIGKHKVGDVVTVHVVRAGQAVTAMVPLIANPANPAAPFLGISRVNVNISLADVSGPSAGLMFTLGIIDKITTGDLTGGKTIAGTGTIDPDGTVGYIGGIQQKLHGAKNAHATVFLVPERNCAEARAAKVKGLELIKIPGGTGAGLHAAHTDLQVLARGGTNVSHC